jgi:integrase
MPQRSFAATSAPKNCRNRERRARDYLTPPEVDHLMRAARPRGRYRHRDATLLLLMDRHGLRVAEAVHLRWERLALKAAVLHVRRVKQGVAAVHPVRRSELRALRQVQQPHAGMAYLFVSERGGPLTTRAVHYSVAQAGIAAGFPLPIHPHMRRHACGFSWANNGGDTRALHQYLGHRTIQHTVRSSEWTPQRFQDFWED